MSVKWSPFKDYIETAPSIDGRYANAAYTLLAAGPPRISSYGGALGTALYLSEDDTVIAYPVGMTQQVGLSQNRQFSRFWEVGSERSYFISGRTMQQMTLSRVYYHGPSLLRVLYAYYDDGLTVTSLLAGSWALNPNPHQVQNAAGYQNLFMNLASDLFAQPVGLMLYMKDSNFETIGAGYCESCVIPNHTLMTDAQGTVVQENVALQFERVVPINVESAAALGEAVSSFSFVQSAAI